MASRPDFETVFSRAPIGIALLDLDGRVLRANPAACELTGYSEAELSGRALQEIAHPDELEPELAQLARLAAGEVEGCEVEKRCLTKRGRSIWALLSCALVRDAGGEPDHIIVQVQDLSQLKGLEERIQELAGEDGLTGLWNRHRFEQEVQRQIARCRRYGEEATLMLIDLDRFKRVNERHGYRNGDLVIRAVGRGIAERMRSSDAVARIGSDEFALLLINVGRRQGRRLAEQLREWIEAMPPLVGERATPVRASIGLVQLDEAAAGEQEAFLAAETAMHEAKRAGGNRVVAAPRPGSPGWALLDSNQ